MPPLPIISLQLKSNDLSVALARKFALIRGQTPGRADYIVNKACAYISLRASQNMPVVPMSRIDAELEAATFGATKTGRPSKAKKPRWRGVSITPAVAQGFYQASMALRIVLARMYPRSRPAGKTGVPYNVYTGQVYALGKPATHGQAAFWQWVAQVASRMIKARHSSMGFYMKCAKAVNAGFGAALGKVRMNGPTDPKTGRLDVNQGVELLRKGLARVEPASGGSGTARFSIADTEPDTKGRGSSDFKRVAQPVWQRAVDAEAASINQMALRELETQLNISGINVT